MGRRVGAACSPDKEGSSRGRPRRGAGVAVQWGGRLHGGERRKASSVLPPTRSVEKRTKKRSLIIVPVTSPVAMLIVSFFLNLLCFLTNFFIVCVLVGSHV